MTSKYNPSESPINLTRRPERARDDDWVRHFLQSIDVGRLATRWDDQPFITPLNFWYDPEQHAIFFHGANLGRMHANLERHEKACFEASRSGKLLPANTALEFGVQFESAIAFGKVHLVEDEEEKRRALYGLIEKYFPGMQPGKHYRPITAAELKRTSVYALQIESWSGKRNWPARAKQSPDWPALGPEWFEEQA